MSLNYLIATELLLVIRSLSATTYLVLFVFEIFLYKYCDERLIREVTELLMSLFVGCWLNAACFFIRSLKSFVVKLREYCRMHLFLQSK